MRTKKQSAATAATILALDQAIRDGLARAEAHGYTRPGDLSACIAVAIKDRGLKVVRQPKPRTVNQA